MGLVAKDCFGNKPIRAQLKFRVLVKAEVVGSGLWSKLVEVLVKEGAFSCHGMYESSPENSPDSRSESSISSNMLESPVTLKESSGRIRRVNVRLERLVDHQRRSNTFYRRKENLMNKVSNLSVSGIMPKHISFPRRIVH